MPRIPQNEYSTILEMVEKARVDEFNAHKNNSIIPCANDNSEKACRSAIAFLENSFLVERFSLLDAIVAYRGYGPSTESDTHYRGRVLENVLNGSFDGKPVADFAYAELKLIETKEIGVMSQVMTAGAIFTRKNGEYVVSDKYVDSKFYNKLKRTIIVSYKKEGAQLGFTVNGVYRFDVNNPLWNKELEEDWMAIRNHMVEAIKAEKEGRIKRKASGIASSRFKTPNGYLGIRSDGVVITNKLFALITK